MPLLERCPHFRGCHVQSSMELGPEDVSLLERCPHFRGCYVQSLMELESENMPLLERCPHFRGYYVQSSMELGPEDVSLLEKCPHFRGCYVQSSVVLPMVSYNASEVMDVLHSSLTKWLGDRLYVAEDADIKGFHVYTEKYFNTDKVICG